MTRPSTSVPFYLDSIPDVKNEFIDFINQNGEYFSHYEVTYDTTNTIQIQNVIYHSKDLYDAFMISFNIRFPAFFQDRETYNLANNIILDRTEGPA